MHSSNEVSSVPRPIGRLHRGRTADVGVWETADDCRLVVLRAIPAGGRLFRLEGVTTPRPSRHSLQVGEQLHLDLGPGHSREEILERYFWRFMNHSCDPSVEIRGWEVVARRNLEPAEAVTYNYNTTEWDMAEPFRCRCGSPRCLQMIRGFKHLSAADRASLSAVAPHLLRLAQAPSPRSDVPPIA